MYIGYRKNKNKTKLFNRSSSCIQEDDEQLFHYAVYKLGKRHFLTKKVPLVYVFPL